MKTPNFWTTLTKNKGFYQFLQRSFFFALIAFGLYTLVFLWIRHLPFFEAFRISEIYRVPFLTGLRKTDFLNSAVFALIAFFLWNRESLVKIAPTTRHKKETIMFALAGLLSFLAHYGFQYWVAHANPSSITFVMIVKYSLLALFFLFTALAIYTKQFIGWLLKTHGKSLLIFLGIGVVYFFLIQFFQLIWYELSYFVTIVLRFLLELTFYPVMFSPGTPTKGPLLGAQGFNVGISNECSGIDSLLLFLSLYTLLFVLDYKKMNVKRMLILLVPGIIGTVAYNILRIYLLMLVGIFIDPRFAVDIFHTNIGWILFLVFFIVFWHYGSTWVYIRHQKPKKRSKKI